MKTKNKTTTISSHRECVWFLILNLFICLVFAITIGMMVDYSLKNTCKYMNTIPGKKIWLCYSGHRAISSNTQHKSPLMKIQSFGETHRSPYSPTPTDTHNKTLTNTPILTFAHTHTALKHPDTQTQTHTHIHTRPCRSNHFQLRCFELEFQQCDAMLPIMIWSTNCFDLHVTDITATKISEFRWNSVWFYLDGLQ